jgi:hypothetical protein
MLAPPFKFDRSTLEFPFQLIVISMFMFVQDGSFNYSAAERVTLITTSF